MSGLNSVRGKICVSGWKKIVVPLPRPDLNIVCFAVAHAAHRTVADANAFADRVYRSMSVGPDRSARTLDYLVTKTVLRAEEYGHAVDGVLARLGYAHDDYLSAGGLGVIRCTVMDPFLATGTGRTDYVRGFLATLHGVFERVRANGQVIEMHGQPLPGGGYVTSYSDITHYKRVERELREMNDSLEQRVAVRTQEAEKAQESRTRFLTAVSHDVLQPINAARLFASALRDTHDLAEMPNLAERVDTSLRTAEELLEGLLDISRLDAGALKPDLGVINVQHRAAHSHTGGELEMITTVGEQIGCMLMLAQGARSHRRADLLLRRDRRPLRGDRLPLGGLRLAVRPRIAQEALPRRLRRRGGGHRHRAGALRRRRRRLRHRDLTVQAQQTLVGAALLGQDLLGVLDGLRVVALQEPHPHGVATVDIDGSLDVEDVA